MTLEYYTYTQGAAITKALNAIATFFSSQSFASMMSISIMIGAAMTYAHFVASRNPKHIYVWAIVFTLVPSMLIKQTVTMQVIDKTEPSSAYSVGNVPYLVALPTWFFSSMMVGSADAIESIFTTTDDERYGRTGMMFGSELYQLSRQSDLKDIGLRRLWNDFFQNCVVGDVQINRKYSWNALMNAKDIFAFLDTQSMSPLRGVILNDISQTFKTCVEVYPQIKAKFTVSAAKELDFIAAFLHGDKALIHKAQIEDAISNSYQKYIGVLSGTAAVLKQNMAINATRYNINILDPSASTMNYAYTSSKMQQTSMWASLGVQAREFIPMMHTMLFTLFSCLGFFVAALALIPAFTKMVLTNYIKTFAYLAIWPSLFALLNAIMTWTLEAHSSATANPMQGLTLSNANALDEIHMRYGYMAGFLMMSIPVLAGKLLQGGAAVAQAMNYQLAGMINSTNARVSAASSTGNLDFGDLQMQNHSFHNMSGNQFSDNTLLKSGMARARQGGSSTTDLQSENGHNIYATGETASKQQWQSPPSNLQQRSRINDSHYTEKADRSQHSNNFNDNLSENFQDRTHWSEQRGSNNTVAQTEQPELLANQSASKMASEVENITATASQTDNPELTYAGKESKALDNESNSLPEPRMCTPSNPLGLSEDEIKAEALARAGDPTANRIDDLLNSLQPASMHRLESMQKGGSRQHADGLEANRKNKGHESGQETAILSPPSNASTRRRKNEVPANLFSKKENGELTIDSAYLPKKKNDTTATLGPESPPLPEPRMCTPSNPMGLSQDEIKAEALARAGDPTANRIDDLLNSPQAASEHRLEPIQPTSSEPDKPSILSTEQMRDAFFRSPLGLAYTGYQLGQQIPNVVNEVSENQGFVVTLGASANGQIGKLTGSVEQGVWLSTNWKNELNFNSGRFYAGGGGVKVAHSNLAAGLGPVATLFSSPDYDGALSGEFKSCSASYNDFSADYIKAYDGKINGYSLGYDMWSFSAVPLKHDPALQCGVGNGDYETWGQVYEKLEKFDDEFNR